MRSLVISALVSISSVFGIGHAVMHSRTGPRRWNDSRTLSGRPNATLNTVSQLSAFVPTEYVTDGYYRNLHYGRYYGRSAWPWKEDLVNSYSSQIQFANTVRKPC
jgi:hypothetical protein